MQKNHFQNKGGGMVIVLASNVLKVPWHTVFGKLEKFIHSILRSSNNGEVSTKLVIKIIRPVEIWLKA